MLDLVDDSMNACTGIAPIELQDNDNYYLMSSLSVSLKTPKTILELCRQVFLADFRKRLASYAHKIKFITIVYTFSVMTRANVTPHIYFFHHSF